MGLDALIDKSIGKRVPQAKYSNSQIIISYILSVFARADRLDNMNSLKRDIDCVEGVELPSPDTISRIFRKMATENLNIKGKSKDIIHEFNINPLLNDLLIKMAIKLGEVKRKGFNVLDYDNTIIENMKFDATHTYKKGKGIYNIKGYQPGFASVNGSPIYVENRSGKSPAQLRIGETIHRSIKLLKHNGVKINRFRSDAAANVDEIFKVCDKYHIDFFIRKKNTENIRDIAQWEVNNEDWKQYRVSGEKVELHSIEYSPFRMQDKIYRVVCRRHTTEKSGFMFSFIITNNWEMSDGEVLQFYNDRGMEEKRFAELKNEFNLKRLPFSFLNENTVFMIIACMAYNFYRYVINRFSKLNSDLKSNLWLRNFRSKFINFIVLMDMKGEYQMCDPPYKIRKLFEKLFDSS